MSDLSITPSVNGPAESGGSVPVNGASVGGSQKAAPSDTVETVNVGSEEQATSVPSSGTPIIREPTEGMSAADMFAMIMGALDRADDERARSAAAGQDFNKETSTSTTSHTRYVVTGGTSKDDPPVITRVTTTSTQTDTDLVADNALLDIPNEEKSKKHFFFPPVFSDFQRQTSHVEAESMVFPALSLLGTSGRIESYDISQARADTASAVAYAEQIQVSVNSGEIQDFANENASTPAEATQYAAVMSTQLLNTSVDQVGQSLDMNGLATQAQLQAELVRNTITVAFDTSQIDSVYAGMDLASLAAQAGMSEDDFKVQIQFGIADALLAGPFYTLEAFNAAFQSSLGKSFSDPALVTAIASSYQTSSGNIALGDDYYSFTFNASEINAEKTINTLTQAILKNWGDSITQVAAANKAAAIVHEILMDDIQGQYKSAQDVRDAIQSELLNSFPDMETETATTIANSIDLGLPKTGPLYDSTGGQVMRPLDFQGQFRNQYESYLGIGPDSSFGQAIEHSVGISNPPEQTSYIGLINQSYDSADSETQNYLNPGTPAGETERQERLYDPGYQLVMMWSPLMDNTRNELMANQRFI